jgi:hypothetical protein
VDDCDGLENHWRRKLPGGSNPSPSARSPLCGEVFFNKQNLKEAPNGEVPEWTIGAAC